MLATLDGAEALDNRLAALPALMRGRLEEKARDLAQALAAKVRDDKLSGSALATKSGLLKASIESSVLNEGDTLTAIVGVSGDVKYAAIQEYGGRTAAHEILPQKSHALAFITGGGVRFARRIEHPGSNLPGRSYLGASLGEMGDEIVGEFAATARQAWEKP